MGPARGAAAMSYPADSLYHDNTDLSVPDDPWVVAGRPGAVDLARRILAWPRVVFDRRDLLLTSVCRDLVSRFRGTLLGLAWVIAHPLLVFAIYAFIFTQLLGLRLGTSAAPEGTLGVYMFTGTLVWTAFADALSRSTSCVLDNRNLLQKLRFPAQLLPLQVGLSSLVTFGAGLAAFWVFTLFSPVWEAPGVRLVLWAPILLLLQLLFSTGLGLALSAIQVALRDTQQLLAVGLTVWMFLTPIFWVPSAELLPGIEPWLGLVEANPVHHLVYLWRDLLMSGEPAEIFGGSFGGSLLVVSIWAAACFAVGSWIFFRAERHFADEV
jgi:lipopolysaccharide transport system permease protein